MSEQTKPEDGGSVFTLLGGITVRDYFAGQALIAVVSTHSYYDSDAERWAKDAYALADAMLREREKGGE